jgi:hypothetical protein
LEELVRDQERRSGHRPMLASPDRGALPGLRSHPSNLIRVMPAKGVT